MKVLVGTAETNWKQGVNDEEYQRERLEHAMRHLMLWTNGDRTEDHLAKVMWFCATQLELERLENQGLEDDNAGLGTSES